MACGPVKSKRWHGSASTQVGTLKKGGAQEDDDDDEFSYAFEGGKREGEFHKQVLGQVTPVQGRSHQSSAAPRGTAGGLMCRQPTERASTIATAAPDMALRSSRAPICRVAFTMQRIKGIRRLLTVDASQHGAAPSLAPRTVAPVACRCSGQRPCPCTLSAT